MALIQCPECGQQISDKARACIHCGFELSVIGQEVKEETKTSVAVQTESEKKENKILEDYSREVFSEATAIRAKWKEQDKTTKSIQFWLKVLIYAIGVIVAVFLILKMKEETSIDRWGIVVWGFRFLSVFVVCYSIEKGSDKLCAVIKEEIQLKTLKSWEKEKYYFYMKNAKLKTKEGVVLVGENDALYDENYLYLKIKELATRLENSSVRIKNILGNIIFFVFLGLLAIVGIAFSLYLLIAVYDSWNTEEMLTRVILPLVIVGVVAIAVAFALKMYSLWGNIKKQDEWLQKVKTTTLEIEKRAKEEERLQVAEQEIEKTEEI